MPMIFDMALEKNRRQAWAKFFQVRGELEAERMRSAELAVWLEVLDIELPDEDSPLRQLIDQSLRQIKSHDLALIRRYVHHQLDPKDAPWTLVVSATSATPSPA